MFAFMFWEMPLEPFAFFAGNTGFVYMRDARWLN
jgi:hypothetical protein